MSNRAGVFAGILALGLIAGCRGGAPFDAAAVSAERPFENSLGMKFVPVPGTDVFFSIWQTRVKDYESFAHATNRLWRKAEFPQGPDEPAVYVSWNDASAFCEWLTARDRRKGLVGEGLRYRLAKDWEWSVAAGLEQESKGAAPKSKNCAIKDVYPWGRQWPPQGVTGNYADLSAGRKHPTWTVIEGYDDGFAETSPAGSFPANRRGIFDLGGNVLEWCDDLWEPDSAARVLRGQSWSTRASDHTVYLASARSPFSPEFRHSAIGFRCVLARVAAEVETAADLGSCRVAVLGAYFWRDWMPVVARPGPDGGSPLHAHIELRLDNAKGPANAPVFRAAILDDQGKSYDLPFPDLPNLKLKAGETREIEVSSAEGPYLPAGSIVHVEMTWRDPSGHSVTVRSQDETINKTR